MITLYPVIASAVLLAKITFLAPKLPKNHATEVSRIVSEYSQNYNIDEDLVLAILYQESTFRKNPRKCHISKEICVTDIGIAQINYRVWKKYFKDLDRKALIFDLEYNLFIAFEILNYYKHKYEKRDKDWFCRYHSATPEFKKPYCRKIRRNLKIISEIEIP